jgi:hypothetical protein
MLRGVETDLSALAILSQFYGVALALEPIFPEIGGSYLASMAVIPIEEIRRILYHKRAAQPFAPEVQRAVSLVDLPSEIVAEYRSHLQWSPRTSIDAYSPASHSPYPPPPPLSHPYISTTSPTTTAGYPTYTASPLHSPLTPAVVGSPYHIPTILEPRREPQIYTASPTLPHDPVHHRTADYKGHEPAVFNPAYLGNLIHSTPSLGTADYHHDSHGITLGGFVAPELWT